jgi:hypothetical protein
MSATNIKTARQRKQEQALANVAVKGVKRVTLEAAWRETVDESNEAIIKALRAGLTVPNVADAAGCSRQHIDKLARDHGGSFPGIRRRS